MDNSAINIAVSNNLKDVVDGKVVVNGELQNMAEGWVVVNGVWKRVWPPTIAPAEEPPVENNYWMYFDFDPFLLTAEDGFLITEVF